MPLIIGGNNTNVGLAYLDQQAKLRQQALREAELSQQYAVEQQRQAQHRDDSYQNSLISAGHNKAQYDQQLNNQAFSREQALLGDDRARDFHADQVVHQNKQLEQQDLINQRNNEREMQIAKDRAAAIAAAAEDRKVQQEEVIQIRKEAAAERAKRAQEDALREQVRLDPSYRSATRDIMWTEQNAPELTDAAEAAANEREAAIRGINTPFNDGSMTPETRQAELPTPNIAEARQRVIAEKHAKEAEALRAKQRAEQRAIEQDAAVKEQREFMNWQKINAAEEKAAATEEKKRESGAESYKESLKDTFELQPEENRGAYLDAEEAKLAGILPKGWQSNPYLKAEIDQYTENEKTEEHPKAGTKVWSEKHSTKALDATRGKLLKYIKELRKGAAIAPEEQEQQSAPPVQQPARTTVTKPMPAAKKVERTVGIPMSANEAEQRTAPLEQRSTPGMNMRERKLLKVKNDALAEVEAVRRNGGKTAPATQMTPDELAMARRIMESAKRNGISDPIQLQQIAKKAIDEQRELASQI